MTDQVFIDHQGLERQPPSGAMLPSMHLRVKAGVLQQKHYSCVGTIRQVAYWINVPTVADDAPDVTG